MEKTIIIFGIIYSSIFIIQYIIYPNLIFKSDPTTAEGELQFEIVGHGFLMLSYFLVLNRFILNRKLKDILLALFFFFVLFKCGFRTLVAGAAVVSAIMIFRLVKFSVRDIGVIVFVGILFTGLTQLKSVAKIIGDMNAKTQSESKMGKNYVRLVDIEFFFKRYPADVSYYIMGGGKPAGRNINNFNPEALLGMNYNIVWVDIGLLGFYMVIGGIALAGLMWYTFKGILVKMPRDKIYLNAYFLYLLLVSFTNEEIYRNGIFCVQAIALYLIDITLDEKSESLTDDDLAKGDIQYV